MKKYLFFFKQYTIKLIILSVIYISTSILNLFITYLSGYYLDVLVENGAVKGLYSVCTLFLVCSFLGLMFQNFINLLMNPLILKITYDIKLYVLKHLQKIPILQYKKFNLSYLSKRLDDDSKNISNFFIENYISFFMKIIEILIIVVLVLQINKSILYLMLLFLPLYFFIYMKTKTKLFNQHIKNKESENNFFQEYTNQLEFLEENVLNSKLEAEEEFLSSKFNLYLDNVQDLIKIKNEINVKQNSIITIMHVSIFLLGGLSIIDGSMTIGNLSILMSYFMQLIRNITYYIGFAQKMQEVKSSLHRIDEILLIEKDKNGILDIEKVCEIDAVCSFEIDNTQILNNVSIKASLGDVIGIVGNNGKGKTTIIKILSGIYNSNSVIKINSKYNLDDLDKYKFRKKFVSYLPQKIAFRNENLNNVFNNVGILNLDNLVNDLKTLNVDLPSSEYTFLKQNWFKNINELSGGDRQFIGILISILRDTSILILDEPSSNLDKERIDTLCYLIDVLISKKIVFIVSHDINLEKIYTKKLEL